MAWDTFPNAWSVFIFPSFFFVMCTSSFVPVRVVGLGWEFPCLQPSVDSRRRWQMKWTGYGKIANFTVGHGLIASKNKHKWSHPDCYEWSSGCHQTKAKAQHKSIPMNKICNCPFKLLEDFMTFREVWTPTPRRNGFVHFICLGVWRWKMRNIPFFNLSIPHFTENYSRAIFPQQTKNQMFSVKFMTSWCMCSFIYAL